MRYNKRNLNTSVTTLTNSTFDLCRTIKMCKRRIRRYIVEYYSCWNNLTSRKFRRLSTKPYIWWRILMINEISPWDLHSWRRLLTSLTLLCLIILIKRLLIHFSKYIEFINNNWMHIVQSSICRSCYPLHGQLKVKSKKNPNFPSFCSLIFGRSLMKSLKFECDLFLWYVGFPILWQSKYILKIEF